MKQVRAATGGPAKRAKVRRAAGTVTQVKAGMRGGAGSKAKAAAVATRAMTGLDLPEDGAGPQLAWELLHQLHMLMKAVMLHDAKHGVAVQAAELMCERIAPLHPPFVLQFVAGGMFLDRTLVPLDYLHFEKCVAVTHSLNRLRAHELAFDEEPSVASMLELGEAMAAGMRGQPEFLKGKQIAGIAWREIPHAQSGIDAEGVDPEVAAIAHSVLGLQIAEQIAELLVLSPDQPWPWNMGLAAIRRLEKGLVANEGAAMRGIEFAPDGWDVPRRAISASMLVLQLLTKVDAAPANRRAAAHATLALALEGFLPRDGVDLMYAADRSVGRMTRAPIQAQSGVAPQCLLVAAIVHLMGSQMHGSSAARLMVTDLIDLVYDMERARCPEGLPFDLGRADLLAHAVGRHGSSEWVRAIIKVCGAVPVGAAVQLADGRVGIVIEPGPPHAPWCPVVFIDGQRIVARQPVMLVPPTKLRRM